MVTHDAAAAAIGDRTMFLADGSLVKDIGRSSASQVLEAMNELTAAGIR
jgi:putative ABC transport system ATP-binding protein